MKTPKTIKHTPRRDLLADEKRQRVKDRLVEYLIFIAFLAFVIGMIYACAWLRAKVAAGSI